MRITYSLFTKMVPVLLATLFILPSCQKEHDTEVCVQSMASVSGTYKVTALKYKSSATAAEEDYMALRENCEQDDLVDLLANGTYTYRDIGVACSPNGTNSGTWSIAGNTIISDGIIAGTIQLFDCHKMIVYSDNIIIPGDKITLTIEKQ